MFDRIDIDVLSAIILTLIRWIELIELSYVEDKRT